MVRKKREIVLTQIHDLFFFEGDIINTTETIQIATLCGFSTWFLKIVYIFIHFDMWKTSTHKTLKFQR